MASRCVVGMAVLVGILAVLLFLGVAGPLAIAEERDPADPPDPLPETKLKIPKDNDGKEVPKADDEGHKVELDIAVPADGIPVAKVRVTTQDDPPKYNDLHIRVEFHGYNRQQEQAAAVMSRTDVEVPEGEHLPVTYPVDDEETPEKEAEEFQNPYDTDVLWIVYCMVTWTKDGEPKLYRLVSATPPR